MRHCADKTVRPVAAADRGLFAWRELQRSVGAEMKQCVRAKTVTGPEIGGHVIVGRCCVGSVDNLEIIVAEAGGSLRNQNDVAEPQAREREIALVVFQAMPRKFAIDGIRLRPHFLGKRHGAPFVIIGSPYDLRIVFPDESFLRSFGILIEHASVLGYHFLKRRSVSRKIIYRVSLRLKSRQKIEQRRSHLHTLGDQSALTRTLEIEYGHFFLLVRLALQGNIVVYRLHEFLQTAGNRFDVRQSVLARKMGEQSEWPDGAVNLRSHDAL